jgi:hypothetical protein
VNMYFISPGTYLANMLKILKFPFKITVDHAAITFQSSSWVESNPSVINRIGYGEWGTTFCS